MANRRKTITLGIALAVAVLATVASAAWVTVPLFVLAAFLMAWGMEPKRTEAFVGRLPVRRWVLGHRKPQQLPPSMAQEQELSC
jgi:hypothetical protein